MQVQLLLLSTIELVPCWMIILKLGLFSLVTNLRQPHPNWDDIKVIMTFPFKRTYKWYSKVRNKGLHTFEMEVAQGPEGIQN